MSMSQIIQRQSIHYSGSLSVLRHFITQVAGLLETLEGDKKMRAFNAVDIIIESKIVTLEVSTFLPSIMSLIHYCIYWLIIAFTG